SHIVPLVCPPLFREQPIYTTRAHVFQIDPTTKKNWVPASKQAVTVSYFYDSTRNSYRIISVDGSKTVSKMNILAHVQRAAKFPVLSAPCSTIKPKHTVWFLYPCVIKFHFHQEKVYNVLKRAYLVLLCQFYTFVQDSFIFLNKVHFVSFPSNNSAVPAQRWSSSFKSVEVVEVIINSTITPNMTFTKTSQKFGQWADSRANTVFGLGFASEQQLAKFAEKFQEVKEAAKLARDKSQEKVETLSNHSQESGRETPSTNQASSINGTDDEKISHVGPEATVLKSENERLKSAVEQSNTNAKKWETELQTLRENNARLVDALQESSANVESWKKQLNACKEESDTLREKIAELEAQCNEADQEKQKNAQLTVRVQELEAELHDKEQELENLRKQAEIIPQLMAECESITAKLQAAETKNGELEERLGGLQVDINDSRLKQGNMKSELKKFMDILDGKIDELHEFRQGLSKLGADN
ncbi:hypothetical protein L3Q82_008655, partial [Scortum barcoo]